jgi:hypothetical protein
MAMRITHRDLKFYRLAPDFIDWPSVSIAARTSDSRAYFGAVNSPISYAGGHEQRIESR